MPLRAIPSPGDPFLVNSGPIHARWYGVLLALGVLLAGWIARREMRRREADPELAYSIAIWTVPLGLIGARLYHVATDWSAFSGNLQDIPAIWQGGLGIYGAVAGGMLGTLIGCRRVQLPFWLLADCIAPGLILAQALGRWGNYANQELYGRPSDLPWAVRIDHPEAPYAPGTTFHPTFLYESVWDVLVFFVLVWFARRYWRRVPLGTTFALYAALYSLGRAPIESLRIDPAHHFFGQRLNVWVAGGVCIVSFTVFVALMRRGARWPSPPPWAPPSDGPPAPVRVAGHVPTTRPDSATAARRRAARQRRRRR